MEFDLVFEGGGAKGIAFIGAIRAFQEAGHDFGRLMGASAGAITATLLAAGYTPAEVEQALNEQRDGQPIFVSFLGEPSPLSKEELENSALRQLLREVNWRLVPDFIEEPVDTALVGAVARLPGASSLLSFAERGGLYSAQNFLVWLEHKLDSGTYQGRPRAFSSMSLVDFHQATGVDLTLIAADITDAQMLVLNHLTAPHCPLMMAVRMSMSFPLLWHEAVWQEEWGLYRKRDISDHAVVDGGLLSNFPIELFISDLAHVTAVMGRQRSENILGFLIDERLPVPGLLPEDIRVEKKAVIRLRTAERLRQLLNTVTQAHDKMVIREFANLVVRLPAAGYGTIEFAMSEARRAALIQAAYQATKSYLAAPPVMQTVKGIFDDPQEIANDVAASILSR